MRNATGKPDELLYNDFFTYLTNDRIETMRITPLGGENPGLYSVSGKYKTETNADGLYVIVLSEDDIEIKVKPLLPLIILKWNMSV